MSALLKLLIVFALSSVKFLLAPPLSFGLGLNFLQTIASTSAGGIMGVLVFFYISKWLIKFYNIYLSVYQHKILHWIAVKLEMKKLLAHLHHTRNRKKKVFTFSNKLYVRIKRKYGLLGIIILTPILLSIPVGAFLAARFYPRQRHLVLYLSGSVIMWSLIMSTAIAIF
ncbi:MAG: hypothetical protein HXX13_11435 [Bacteroidetes bacterium]|nr:hypothetical protein [Bacteroidota bacterium]